MLAILGGEPQINYSFDSWPIIKEEDEVNILKTFKSKRWGGDFLDSNNYEFEKKFSAYLNIKNCITISSGTSALMLALLAIGIKPGDEVLVPAMTFIATATAVSLIGAIPVFLDIDSKNHCVNSKNIQKGISEKTKAIVIVHIGGCVCDMDDIMEYALENKLVVIEDCAQAIGAEWCGKKVGTFGEVGIFSFAQNKNLVAGEGGAVVTNNLIVANKVRALKNHGRIKGMDYHHESLGYNFRMTEFQATLLSSQLERLDDILDKKMKFANEIIEQIKKLDFDWITIMEVDSRISVHGYFSFVFLYKEENFGFLPKSHICDILLKEGVPVGKPSITPHVIYENPIYNNRESKQYSDNRILPTPNAINGYKRMIVLGQAIGSAVMLGSQQDAKNIVKAIEKINKNKKCIIEYYKTKENTL
ncbi:MAG: DegT/DnrJ/EryC1/StrS family aminotransferase [Clostridium sp.]